MSAAAVVAGFLLPSRAAADDAEHADAEIVAEALFMYDALPPGGRDLNLSLAFEEGEPDPASGKTEPVSLSRVQLAMALDRRLGFTADVGISTDGSDVFDTPAASLKYLLRAPRANATGLAASLDLFGSTPLSETEAGLGLGAIRAIGPVALRATVSGATAVSTWSPHLHGGFSAAVALGSRWRALGEVVTDVSGGELTVAAGPSVKLALGERTALMAGALFGLAPEAARPAFAVQLTQSL